MTDKDLVLLEQMAAALVGKAGTVAHALATGRETRNMDAVALQMHLGVDRLGLVRLRLCGAPHSRRELEQVARYAGADCAALAALLAEAGGAQ